MNRKAWRFAIAVMVLVYGVLLFVAYSIYSSYW